MKYQGIELFNHVWKAFRIAIITLAAFFLIVKMIKAEALGHPLDIEIGIQIFVEEWKREREEGKHRFDFIFEGDEKENEREPEQNRGTVDHRDRD